jgi:hypothetical protein
MKRFIQSKKGIVALLATLTVVVFSAIGAYAYFTANGSGTGSATVGSVSGITLAGTITGDLYPGGAPAGVSVLVTNPGSGAQTVGTIHLDSITADAGHPTCVVSSSGAGAAFTMADIAVNTNLAAGASTTKTGSLQMNDTGVSQNGCQGATLTLNLSSN